MSFRKIIPAIPARPAEPARPGIPAHPCDTVTTSPARARRVVTVKRAGRRVIGG
ncbi:hypothetical protein AB0D04_10240 [Streptomyces sp. NPDC048483]|uniref:hypothetical protein n=1 Tax=Streptomyces sp. NPDC048483 TaxID=3154927 RepID=UPI0034489A30